MPELHPQQQQMIRSILFNNKPAFLEPQQCYSILAKSHTSLRWVIPAHTHPLHPMLLPCVRVYTAILCLMELITLFPGKPEPAVYTLLQCANPWKAFESKTAFWAALQAANSAG